MTKLEKLLAAIDRVLWFDWSDNDMDAVAAMDFLRKERIAFDAARPAQDPTREQIAQAFETIRLKLIKCLDEPERSAFWLAVEMRDALTSAMRDLPAETHTPQVEKK